MYKGSTHRIIITIQIKHYNRLSLCLVILRKMRVTPLSVCLRFIIYEKPLNLEKTTSNVLSVLLLIYDNFAINKNLA